MTHRKPIEPFRLGLGTKTEEGRKKKRIYSDFFSLIIHYFFPDIHIACCRYLGVGLRKFLNLSFLSLTFMQWMMHPYQLIIYFSTLSTLFSEGSQLTTPSSKYKSSVLMGNVVPTVIREYHMIHIFIKYKMCANSFLQFRCCLSAWAFGLNTLFEDKIGCHCWATLGRLMYFSTDLTH